MGGQIFLHVFHNICHFCCLFGVEVHAILLRADDFPHPWISIPSLNYPLTLELENRSWVLQPVDPRQKDDNVDLILCTMPILCSIRNLFFCLQSVEFQGWAPTAVVVIVLFYSQTAKQKQKRANCQLFAGPTQAVWSKHPVTEDISPNLCAQR